MSQITANPRCVRLTVAGSTPQSLWTLLSAIDAQAPRVAQFIQIQASLGNLDKIIYVGNSDLNTTTRFGAELQAGQTLPLPSLDSNLIQLDQIYLATDGTNQNVNVAFVTR